MTAKANWSRRDFLHCIASLCAAASLVRPSAAAPARDAPRPNIILLVADDLGYAELGCYGQNKIQTPHLDQLASEGMRFTQFYAGAPVCAPSRAVLMTGLHTGHARIRGNHALVAEGPTVPRPLPGRRPFLLAEDITIGKVLQQAGYHTALFGKWHQDGNQQAEAHPLKQGFDTFTPMTASVGMTDEMTDDRLTDAAVGYLTSRTAERPFFMMLGFAAVHMPYLTASPEPYGDENWTSEQKQYAAVITRMDGHVGRIMTTLRALQLDQNTLVCFCSDNGAVVKGKAPAGSLESRYFETFGDGPSHAEFFQSAGPLRGGKRDLLEGGLRVPMIMRWPASFSAGQTIEAPGHFADLLPTFAELAGAPAPAGLDGRCMAPLCHGREQTTEERVLYWEFFEFGFQQAARWRNWKALRLHMGGPLQVYDLSSDPAESLDISSTHPEVVSRFERYFKHCRTESPYWPTDRMIPYLDD